MGASPVRHCLAALPPGFPSISFGVNFLFIAPNPKQRGVVRRAANQKSIDCRWQSHLCLMADVFVTWNDLFQFCTVILTVILLVYQMTNKEK